MTREYAAGDSVESGRRQTVTVTGRWQGADLDQPGRGVQALAREVVNILRPVAKSSPFPGPCPGPSTRVASPWPAPAETLNWKLEACLISRGLMRYPSAA